MGLKSVCNGKTASLTAMFVCVLVLGATAEAQQTVKQGPVEKKMLNIPKLRVQAEVTYAPEVPAPITRTKPAVVEVHLVSTIKRMEIKAGVEYDYWTFNDSVPGPFIRTRVGDTLEVHHTSTDPMGMPHNVDFHAVTGPGGGAPVLTIVKGEERVAWFKLLHPGLFIYHCAAPPVMDHIANGMYGLILVEPKNGLSRADKEFYVMQHEIYGEFAVTADVLPAPVKEETGHGHDDFWGEGTGEGEVPEERGLLKFSHQNGLDENPKYVFFNGRHSRHIGENSLKAKTGDRVRIFFGNIGPNLISSFHVIGEIFDNVYREADLVSPPGHSIQTTLVPAGGAAVVEFDLEVPGTFTLVDHAIFRVEKGAVGYLEVEGQPNYDVFASDQDAVICPGCLIHP